MTRTFISIMDYGSRILPVPLWLEYTRIKQELESKLAIRKLIVPVLKQSQPSQHNRIGGTLDRREDNGHKNSHQHTPEISVSTLPELTTEDLKPRTMPSSQRLIGQDILMHADRSSLKQSIHALKQSVQEMKQNSEDLYRSISQLSTSASFLTFSSPTNLKASVYNKMSLFSRSSPEVRFREDMSQPSWPITEEKSVQVDHAQHYLTPNETMESAGKLSFSQLIDSKKESIPTQPLLVPESESSDSESRRIEQSENLVQDFSPRSVPPNRIQRTQDRNASLTATPRAIPAGKRLTLEKTPDTSSPKTPSLQFSKTMEGLPPSPASGDRSKSAVYYMKVLNVNGKYYASEPNGQELILGKQANQGIALKGRETVGGFRLFTSAPDAMNREGQHFPVKKGGRIALMKVYASGPSLK